MNSDNLLAAVAALIDSTKVGLWRDDEKRREWHEIPSLWDQLESASSPRSGGTSGGAMGSKPAISTDVVALIIKITETTTEAALDKVGETRGNVPGNIRAITANLHEFDQVKWWTDELNKWAAEARMRLQLDPPHAKSARGAACPECKAKVSYTHQDGENIRRPALAIQWVGPDDDNYHADEDWKVRAVECLACNKAWFRGEQMDALIDMMLESNRTMETMTDAVPRRRKRRRL